VASERRKEVTPQRSGNSTIAPELIGFLPSRARGKWVWFGIWLPPECLECFERIWDVHWSWRGQ